MNPGAGVPAPASTGAVGGGVTSMPGVSGGRGGITLDLRRHEQSRRLLKIDWTHAAVLEDAGPQGPTSSARRMVSLEREAALAKLTEKDLRPLLLLRECERCKGTEHALLSRSLDNERLQLLLRFFHCVKFRPNVLEPAHPYRKLFDEQAPAHLMVLSADGKQVYAFDGNQDQRDLRAALERLLAQEYERSAERAIDESLKLMTHYDVLDLERKALTEEMETEIEKDGPRSHRAQALKTKLSKVERKIATLREQEAEILDLGLKRAKL